MEDYSLQDQRSVEVYSMALSNALRDHSLGLGFWVIEGVEIGFIVSSSLAMTIESSHSHRQTR